MRLNKKILLVLASTFLLTLSWAATLTTTVDRNPISLGETFQLIISMPSNDPIGPIGLDALDSHFNILGSGSNQQLSIVNGQVNRVNEFIITLSAKQQGKLLIPSFRIGQNQTQALTIDVTSANQPAALNKQKHIIIDTTVDTKNPYVQSEVLYTLKIYYDVSITNAAITPPSSTNAQISQIGRDQSYTATYEGRRYNVFQRNYALYPQTPGDVVIKAPVFHGDSTLDPQSSSPFGNFIDDGSQPIQMSAKNITLNVKPQPTLFHGRSWLPAKNLQLKQTWSQDPNQMRVGEPITRTITVEARGVTPNQLPDLQFSSLSNMNIYPGLAQFRNTAVDNSNVVTRTQKIVYIPTKPATVVIPAIELSWWNTASLSEQTAHLPSQTINVRPSANTITQQTATPALTDNHPLTQTIVAKNNYISNYWFYMVIILFLAWIITLTLWLWSKKKNNVSKHSQHINSDSESKIKQAIKFACQANDPQTTYQNLLAWLRIKFPECNLEQIKAYLNDKEIKHAIDQLERHLYSKNNAGWSGTEFWKIFSTAKFDNAANHKTTQPNELPELYL